MVFQWDVSQLIFFSGILGHKVLENKYEITLLQFASLTLFVQYAVHDTHQINKFTISHPSDQDWSDLSFL